MAKYHFHIFPNNFLSLSILCHDVIYIICKTVCPFVPPVSLFKTLGALKSLLNPPPSNIFRCMSNRHSKLILIFNRGSHNALHPYVMRMNLLTILIFKTLHIIFIISLYHVARLRSDRKKLL